MHRRKFDFISETYHSVLCLSFDNSIVSTSLSWFFSLVAKISNSVCNESIKYMNIYNLELNDK